MIEVKEVFSIGHIVKPHGIDGELVFDFKTDVFDSENAAYLIFDIDGILVPFFIADYRFTSANSCLIQFDDIDSAEKARMFSGKEVFLPLAFQDKIHPEELGLHYFTGFSIIDELYGDIGIISDVDTSTQNMLFIIEKDGNELLIPASDDYITNIDEKKKILRMRLPEGLLDI